ncbi:hypothetical protein [uncultured Eubacterium sp.]|mgnify:FL=1|uniref:hypothetical protein n=1 Tax=uncultured Eubacterium sp. TaxID=165185 RepID=UPI0025FE049F|nr:hypothetical protein [uncultured Eubacterium sp.]
MKNSKIIAYSGVATALSVVMLFLGSIFWVLGYTMPLVASLVMIILLDSISQKSALLTFISTSIISFILLNDKECVLLYILFFGYYPLIRDKINDIKPKFLSYLLKFITFNAAMVLTQVLCVYVFGIPFDDMLGKWGIVLFVLCLNLVFVVFDKLYTLLLRLYRIKLKKKVEKYIK